MLKVNRKLEYALISLKHMQQKDSEALTSAKEISDLYNTPFDPTSRGLQILSHNGILHASQGAHGGYRIAKDLKQVTLMQIVDLLVGPIEIANCLNEENCTCKTGSTCQIISPILVINDRINELFKNISVAELLNEYHPHEAHVKERLAQTTK